MSEPGGPTAGDRPARAAEDTVDRGVPAKPTAARCDLCGGPMTERHCKLTCGQCGYMRDCSDP